MFWIMSVFYFILCVLYIKFIRSYARNKVSIPYILESNPHPFYSFRGLKNQMRIRFAVVS